MPIVCLRRGDRGEDVKLLQHALHLIPDGIFGPLTQEAVETYQRENGLAVDGLAGLNTLRALGLLDGFHMVYCSRRIDKVILHCLATPEGRDYSVAQVREWHVKDRGFADIGYHYLIHIDGTVEEGRPLDMIGAHCTGQNAHSIGVVYAGGVDKDDKPKDTRTPAQRNAMRSLVDYLKRKYGATVHCHNEFANKACPSFKINEL